jgi:arginyl-tRNA synthetase
MPETANPYEYILSHIASKILDRLPEKCSFYTEISRIKSIIEEPPSPDFGDIGIPVPRLMQLCGLDFHEASEIIKEALNNIEFVREVKQVKHYIDAFIDAEKYSKIVFEALRKSDGKYGYIENETKKRIVVEYVSANPVHPLHVGSGRNAALGEFVAKIYEIKGHTVQRRYYIDDMGLQVAYLAYGYSKLKHPNPPENLKIDHWLGLLYAVTHTIVDIVHLKKEVLALKDKGNYEEYNLKHRELMELVGILSELRSKMPEVVDKLVTEIQRDENPREIIEDIMRKYEKGDPTVTHLVKTVVSLVIEGIRHTLERLGIAMDKWDWESDLIKEGLVKEILEKASKSPYYVIHKGVPALDFRSILKNEAIRDYLRIPKTLEIPPLILVRSDGTTLYTTRDIAYSLKKFRDFSADAVINVIAVEQTLPQAQIRLALYALGYTNEAKNLYHYSYEMVNLPGTKMSGRRGKYITIDQVLDELRFRVEELMKERGNNNEELVEKIARSAFKYVMLSASPTKPVTFNISKAVDLSSNSAPYLQYSYARASGVLRKYGKPIDWENICYKCTEVSDRKKLVWFIGKFPAILNKVAEDLTPEILTTYLNNLADVFNSWYSKEQIIREPNEGERNLKLAITYGVREIIKNGLYVLGLDAPERI